MRHPHGKNIHANSRKFANSNLVAQFTQLAKERACLLWIFRKRWDGHKTADLEVIELGSCGEKTVEFRRIRRHSALGGFASYVHLDQHGEFLARLARGVVQLFRQLERVDRIDGAEKFGSLAGLVRLQVADHVPPGVSQIAQAIDLTCELLHPIFAEMPDASLVSLADALSGEGLADGHECDFAGIAPGTGGGGSNLFLYPGYVFGNRHRALTTKDTK